MRLAAPMLLGLSACNLVFAVTPEGEVSDAEPPPLVRFHVGVDEVTTTITPTAAALDLRRSYVLVDDQVPPRRVELTEVGPGEYTAPVPIGAAFRLVRPDPVTDVLHVSELPAREQQWRSVFVGHRDEVAAAKGDTFDLDVLRDAPGVSSCYLVVTGSWLAGTVPGCEVPGDALDPAPLRWSILTSISGRPAPRPQPGDLVHLLRYADGDLLGAMVDVAPSFGPGTVAVNGAITAVTPNREMNTLVIDHGIGARLAAAEPAPTTTTDQRWDVFALPAVPLLFSGPVLLGSNLPFTAGTIATPFANPFAWPAVLVVQQVLARDTVVGGSQPVRSYTAAAVYTDQLGAPSSSVELHVDAAVPTQVVVAGTSLANDDTMVAIGGGGISVDVELDGPADLVLLTVSRADVLGGRLTFTPVLAASSVRPHFSIPDGILAMATTYQIRVTTRRGLPGLADGDPGVALPLAVAYHDSATFSLVP